MDVPPDETTIEAWCRAAAQGDHDALGRLVLVYHPRLLGLATRRIGVDWKGRVEATDVLQEAYATIARRVDSFAYDGADSFYHWASEIVGNRIIDEIRRVRRKKRDVSRDVRADAGRASSYANLFEKLILREAALPTRSLQEQEAMAAILSCMARLSDEYRVLVDRLHIRGEPLSAVAADIAKTEDAVRRMAGRALGQLSSCVGRASQYLSTGW